MDFLILGDGRLEAEPQVPCHGPELRPRDWLLPCRVLRPGSEPRQADPDPEDAEGRRVEPPDLERRNADRRRRRRQRRKRRQQDDRGDEFGGKRREARHSERTVRAQSNFSNQTAELQFFLRPPITKSWNKFKLRSLKVALGFSNSSRE